MDVSKEKRDELVEALTFSYASLALYNKNEAIAEIIADRVIKAGWVPPGGIELAGWEKDILDGGPWKVVPFKDYHDYEINDQGQVRNRKSKEYVTPEWDERFQGWCIKLSKSEEQWVSFDAVQLAKDFFKTEAQEIDTLDRIVAGLSPRKKEEPYIEPTWSRIPEYRDYEMRRDGTVRNFWTKRVLRVVRNSAYEEVELHGRDGTPVFVAINGLMKATFGE